ncbi:NADAR family protein [Terasakiella pusilla]|uniref:NADAR family protein n=1 Tax=Terasakiella pusilla TaxID=64973 RepID=UPI003AA998F9
MSVIFRSILKPNGDMMVADSKIKYGLSESHLRTYQRADCAVFKSTHAQWGGFSNMAAGFPIVVAGVEFRTSEALYQCCRYPHLPEVQAKILDQGSPMTAKMVGKPYRSETRPNWDYLRVTFMRWALHQKLLHNWDRFGDLLLQSEGLDIVEESIKDCFWGAQPGEFDQLVGFNVLGRLLMDLRQNLIDRPESLLILEPPQVDHFLFFGNEANSIMLADEVLYERIGKKWELMDTSTKEVAEAKTDDGLQLFA